MLNSILLEGTISGEIESIIDRTIDRVTECVFSVLSSRSDIDGHISTVTVKISTTGRLAETCASVLKTGRGVRVLGRLYQHPISDEHGWTVNQIYIIAEHVEFSPEVK